LTFREGLAEVNFGSIDDLHSPHFALEAVKAAAAEIGVSPTDLDYGSWQMATPTSRADGG
jgi:hypothetical protein